MLPTLNYNLQSQCSSGCEDFLFLAFIVTKRFLPLHGKSNEETIWVQLGSNYVILRTTDNYIQRLEDKVQGWSVCFYNTEHSNMH